MAGSMGHTPTVLPPRLYAVGAKSSDNVLACAVAWAD